jgi:hypothetical protein
VTILVILLAVGALSRGEAAPPTATIPAVTPSPVPTDPTIRVVVVAKSDVTVRSDADGVRDSRVLRTGETITLVAVERLDLSVEDAGLVEVSLNGKDVTEGVAGAPYTYPFRAGDDGGDASSNG